MQLTENALARREKTVDTLSEITAHWLATGNLPPALITGHKLIDTEHRFLIESIANLRRICIDSTTMSNCCACAEQRQNHCESALISMLGDVFAFMLEHFKTEESIMRDSLLLMVDRDVCLAHMEDHAEISAKVQEVVSALDRDFIVARIRDLDTLLTRWVIHHIALHDLLLARWIARDDSMYGRL